MTTFKQSLQLAVLMLFCLADIQLSIAQNSPDVLRQGFENPPNGARPRVWWHWMNGNVTKDGIKLDLEWMHRVGIGGFQNFDAALSTPQYVQKRLVYMTPEWKDAFKYATTLADQFGLEEAIAGSPGWSESGGPWVKPQQGMKKVVWSETRLEGGKPFSGVLPHPPTTTGPFQDLPVFNFFDAVSHQSPSAGPTYYADTAVIAYRAPTNDVLSSSLNPAITSSGGTIDAALLADGDLVKTTQLPKAPVGQQAWIQYEFPVPQTIRALTLVMDDPYAESLNTYGAAPSIANIESSDDGQAFRKLADIPADGGFEHTIAFLPATAKFFRVAFITRPSAGGENQFDVDNAFGDFSGLKPDPNFEIAELVLHPDARISRFEEKAGFANLPSFDPYSTPDVPPEAVIRKEDVIDLTSEMKPDGTLNWTPPNGNWVVLRFGYSLLGITNHPASPEGTGLEVDKLNPDDVRQYFNTYLDNYKNAVGSELMGKHGLQYVINDSWEAGAQNWTDNMIQEFTKRRGYDPRPWMPVLTGRVIESTRASEAFLWDFRETLGDMLADYHYDLLTKMLHERGMGHYGESHEEGRAFIGDGMQVKRSNDVPMSAMWTQKPGINNDLPGYNADIRESASVAHIYGQNLVAAESMTAKSGAWAWSPQTLKPTADKELAMGLNRFVIHTSVHQPLIDKKPGFALGPFGQWFNRNDTWAEEAKPWITYLARNDYLLQQGRFVADILYFYGEDTNLTDLFRYNNPDIPEGYNWDYINADALIHVLTFKDGQLATPSGMRYRILALDPHTQKMSLPAIRKILDLVEAGAIVCGAKPTDTPSLADDETEFHHIADELWGSGEGARVGKGRVYGGQTLQQTLGALHIAPDFSYTRPEPDTSLLFVHRKLSDGDLYYVDNRNDRYENLSASFRVSGKAAELWHADSGEIEPASYYAAYGRTTVPLNLAPWETVFVVFRKSAKALSRTLPTIVETPVATIDGPWQVTFPPDLGAPTSATLDRLADWTESADPGIKYFSGIATYSKTIDVPAPWLTPGAHIWLDLGAVKNMAEVSVNGKPLGIAWKQPFRIDMTSALKAGPNSLEVKVTNGWANRIIGDRQPGATTTYTFTSPKFYNAQSHLWPSGLLGPIQIVQTTKRER